MSRRQLRTAEAIEAFIASRRARGCSPAYEAWLRWGLGFMARAYVELPAAPEQLELVLAQLRGLGDESRYDVWRVLRRFYRWSSRRLGVVDAMADDRGELLVEAPARRPKLPKSFDRRQADRIMLASEGLSARDRALLLLLLDTGLRIGEVAALTWDHVGADYVRVPTTGKTGEGEVPISAETARALRRLPPGPLWISRKGGPLSVSGLQQVVRRLLRDLGLRGGPHRLRHTFGRLYVLAGGDVFSLQRVMRHRNLATTRVYLELDGRDVAEQHRRFSPVARLHQAGQGQLFGADAAGGS